MDGDDVSAGLGEVGHAELRLHNHQVAVEGLVGDWAEGVNHQGADGDVGHEAAVHDVDVDPVAAGLVNGLHLEAQGRGGGSGEAGRGERAR